MVLYQYPDPPSQARSLCGSKLTSIEIDSKSLCRPSSGGVNKVTGADGAVAVAAISSPIPAIPQVTD
jgi:hypothetical protein